MSGRDGRTAEEARILRAMRHLAFGLGHIRTSGIEEAIESRRPLNNSDWAEWIEAVRERLDMAHADVKATELERADMQQEIEFTGRLIRRMLGEV